LTTRSDDDVRLTNHRPTVAELRRTVADLERQLAEARGANHGPAAEPDPGSAPTDPPEPAGKAEPAGDAGQADRDEAPPADWRAGLDGRITSMLRGGRSTAQSRLLSRKRLMIIGGAVLVVVLLIGVWALSSGGASWPASVTTVQNEITRACGNADVASEPGQVNFACGKSTRQVLWVFSLLTSNDNPAFADGKSGRIGLEPITPSEGGEVAWSLNLHHPYDPTNPIDSLEVAARAINNIVGGATVTGTGGSSIVQPGLESSSANCVRYTGSAALDARKGFPAVCAQPVSAAGEAALVADVFQKWIVGASPSQAQDAALLFENSGNPGNPMVQAILRGLPGSRP
jgi:hypothetical protein